MKQRKKEYASILAVLMLIVAIIGVSYAAFSYTGTGQKLNTITTGVLTMSYEESTNIIKINKALPTTDTTGKKQLNDGEYFDFTLSTTIQGTDSINWEIAAEDITSSTAKKIDGSHIKLYLTSIDNDGTETEVMSPKVYQNESSDNTATGRPTNMMSLATGTTTSSFSTKYRLRMYVDENYNPQDDGGDLNFTVKVNVYGKKTDGTSSSDTPITGETAETLVKKANPESLDYNNATDDQKNQMWAFSHGKTEQLGATTDYRYIGANPNNYVKFNDELWRIIGVFDVDDGTGKIEKRMKIIRNESIGEYSWDNKSKSTGATTDWGENNWSDARLNYLLNPGHESETYGGSLYWNRKSGTCYAGSRNATTSCDFTSTGLNDTARKMIGDATWYLGGTPDFNSFNTSLTSDYYKNERGTRVHSGQSKNWTGKVGLIYPSDYGYATSGGSTTNRVTCRAKALSIWDNYGDCKDNDWLYNSSQDQWTMTLIAYDFQTVEFVKPTGRVYYTDPYNTVFTRPVVYLKSTIKVTSGTGSSDSPFILG